MRNQEIRQVDGDGTGFQLPGTVLRQARLRHAGGALLIATPEHVELRGPLGVVSEISHEFARSVVMRRRPGSAARLEVRTSTHAPGFQWRAASTAETASAARSLAALIAARWLEIGLSRFSIRQIEVLDAIQAGQSRPVAAGVRAWCFPAQAGAIIRGRAGDGGGTLAE